MGIPIHTPISSEDVTGTEPLCARVAAFCGGGPDVFQSIVYQPQIWQADPFDVETIHAEARDQFVRLLSRVSGASPAIPGRLLLLHGEAGSGKTHLMRAFRAITHADGAGYFAYLQMTTEAGNYGRYLLGNLIASLDQPYHPPYIETSGLSRLSDAVLEAVPNATNAERAALRDGSSADPHAIIHEWADRLLLDERTQRWQVDVDLLRAALHLQRQDPRVKMKVLKWLRCENLAAPDRAALGDLVPRTEEHEPLWMVSQIGRLAAALQAVPLVLCVDQLEDMFGQDMAAERFRRVVDTLVSLLDQVPNAVIVLSCLEDYYVANRQHLTRSKIDRLERDPEPVRLTSQRTYDEIVALVGRRLERLYEEAGLVPHPQESISPFRPEHLRPLVNLSSRNVLDQCRRHQERCSAAGKWLEPEFAKPEIVSRATVQTTPTFDLESAWNDFRAAHQAEVPEDESDLARLLHWGIAHAGAEGGSEYNAQLKDRSIHVSRTGEQFLVAVCEKKPQGGGLARQVAEAEAEAKTLPIVLVRSYPFPKDPRAVVSKQIARLIAKGGRRVEIENSDWRTLLALRHFAAMHAFTPYFDKWQRDGRPLSQLAGIRKVLGLDRIVPDAPQTMQKPEAAIKLEKKEKQPAPSEPVAASPSARPTSPGAPPPTPTSDLILGHARSLNAAVVKIAPPELKQHMAFIGGSGSGKSTAALALVEQLLMQGVPAILIDRKGDLSRYADPEVWEEPADSEAGVRLAALQGRIDVALYTPGTADGRPLSIPIVPDDLRQLPMTEREQIAEYSAASIGGMMGYRPGKQADTVLQVILARAILLLAESQAEPVTLDGVYEVVQSQDDALLNVVNGYDLKHFKKLAENLLTLKLGQSRLVSAAPDVERLDIDALLGRASGTDNGRTRLSIINTQFLGGAAGIDFWLSQFLIALDRWRAKSPSDSLQAVVLLDEADQYLPAIRQPATKAPLESLLRRGRSAGLGVLLATQSPADFDYKCRDNIRAWLVGRVAQATALAKLKPLFADAKLDAGTKLPAQETGEFYLLRERDVQAVKTDRSLVQTRQLPESRILELARDGRRGA